MIFEQDSIDHSEVEIRILEYAMMKPCKSLKVAPTALDRWMYDVCWAGDTAAQRNNGSGSPQKEMPNITVLYK